VSRLRAIALAALAAALVAAGCGEDEADTRTITESGTGEGDDTSQLVIEAERGAFDAQAVYEAAAESVVTIRSIFETGTDPITGGAPAGQGSGFVISGDGEVVTNAHVVTDGQARGSADVNAAREVFVQFGDGNTVEAEIVGFDPFADVALLNVDPPEGTELNPIELGDLNQTSVGDPVAAIGSPFGQERSLSVGVISALNRPIPSLTQFDILGAIQTDASINPGNSGGPLLDEEARVIGINQQIDTTSGGNQGVGFAVPIDLVTRSIEQLRGDGDVDYAYLGVETQAIYPQLAERIGLDVDTGALIASVTPGGPAEAAGIEAGGQEITFQGVPYTIGGDAVVAVDGEPIEAETDLPRIISRLDPDAEITIEVIRDGEHQEIDVQLEERPDDVPSSG
jgi:S1-C subfamily serine protease